MYMKREIDESLEEWKNAEYRKPLLLRGVRQCGKTSAVRELALSFDSYIELNLEKQPALCELFEKDIDIPKIIRQLEIKFETRIIGGETLLFIDEIQECPRAITALRYFYEDMPQLHVIAAGSLLEFVLNTKGKNRIDFPVGRIRSIYMYPFSFREYLKGTGKVYLAEYLQSYPVTEGENLAHEQLLESYKEFLIVGGMPEAVSRYVQTGSLLECQRIHRDILASFKDDFNKYDSAVPADIIRRVFDYAMHNVCGQTKASSAISGISGYYFEECIRLLRRAGVVYPVKASPCDTLPLGAAEKEANKKLLVFDTGVYLTECGLDASGVFAAKVFDDMNKGNVVEMQTGLELIKYMEDSSEAELFYWYRSGANAEIDYVLGVNGKIVPIEVKAAKKGSMQSMRSFLETHPKSLFGIRVSMESFTSYDNIRVMPVYALSKIREAVVQ